MKNSLQHLKKVSKQVYRPPAAQGKPASFKLHDEETSSTTSQNASSVSLTKNQKKNLARKAKKQSENASTEKLEQVTKNDSSHINELTGDPEKDKKIKSILKKLDQIQKLKRDQEAGKTLELNQIEKIKKAGELEEELQKLHLN